MKIENLLSFVPKILPNTRLFEVARIMADYRLRALQVVQNNTIIGKIDVKALVNKIKNSVLGNVKVSKIMIPQPITVTPSEKISKAREIMLKKRIDHLPVEKNRKICGILTSEQIVFNFITDYGGDRYVAGVPDTLKLLNYPVEAIMETHPLECEPQTPIRNVADKMLAENRSYTPVTLGEELHGIITYRDFTKLIVTKEEANVSVYIVGLPDNPFETEAAKTKFIRLVNILSKFLPSILETRSVIKTSYVEGQKRRYEVNVDIRTARKNFNYTTGGWDLPTLYDEITTAIKRMATSKKRDVKRGKGRLSIEGV
ncbi:MAG: CBS domain-containing protein [Candidatus Bathyarchaeia archaeon]